MYYYIEKYNKKIQKYERRQYKVMKILKKIDSAGLEKDYGLFLTKSTEKINKYDNLINKYMDKKDFYISLHQKLKNN